MIVYHPTDSTLSCDLSKRGRRPNWYYECFPNGHDKIVSNNGVILEMAKEKIKEMQKGCWRWVGVRDSDEETFTSNRPLTPVPRIFVTAKTSGEAIRLLNKTFKNPVSQLEFNSCWKLVEEPNEFMLSKDDSVWEEIKGEWRQRKTIDK